MPVHAMPAVMMTHRRAGAYLCRECCSYCEQIVRHCSRGGAPRQERHVASLLRACLALGAEAQERMQEESPEFERICLASAALYDYASGACECLATECRFKECAALCHRWAQTCRELLASPSTDWVRRGPGGVVYAEPLPVYLSCSPRKDTGT